MTGEALGYINDVMDSLKIPYAFDLWKGSPPELYFVGEYQESDADNQMDTGYEETAFTLSGFARGEQAVLNLENAKEKIKNSINRTAILPSGSGIAVFYNTGYPVDTGLNDRKRIDIKITVKEWRVN